MSLDILTEKDFDTPDVLSESDFDVDTPEILTENDFKQSPLQAFRDARKL